MNIPLPLLLGIVQLILAAPELITKILDLFKDHGRDVEHLKVYLAAALEQQKNDIEKL